MVIEIERRSRANRPGGVVTTASGDAGCSGTKGWQRPAPAEAVKGINDAPDGSEEPMNGETSPVVASQDIPFSTRRTSSAEQSAIDGHGLQTLEFWGMRVSVDATDLALQFAIARGIDVGERRSDVHEGLRVAMPRLAAENAQELVLFRRMRPNMPSFCKLMALKQRKKKSRAGDDTSNQAGFA